MEKFIQELAARLLTHLNYELKKPKPLLESYTMGGRTPLEWTIETREKILEAFPDLTPSPVNFFEELTQRAGRDTYESTTFEVGNVHVYNRIMDFKINTPEFRQQWKEEYFAIMQLFDHKKHGLDIRTFMHVESVLREIMREICEKLYSGEEYLSHWKRIIEQGLEYQDWMSIHFEDLLTGAWQESEDLLSNILPTEIISELKEHGRVEPVHVKSASVLFTDFEGFTKITSTMKPERLIEELDICFKRFDQIITTYNLEKIKTLGDGYLCAGGIPYPSTTHVFDICMAALALREASKELASERRFKCGSYWNVRIGIHTGELVAGIVGEHKFSYDIWGDTVNVASRLESNGIAGEINISSDLQTLIDPFFTTIPRGPIAVKNRGEIDMYLLKCLRQEYASNENCTTPNDAFYEALESRNNCTLNWQQKETASPGRDVILNAI